MWIWHSDPLEHDFAPHFVTVLVVTFLVVVRVF